MKWLRAYIEKLKARLNAWIDGPPPDPDEEPVYVRDASGELRFYGMRQRRH